MKGLFKITKENIASALVYGFLTLSVTFLLAVTQSVLDAGSVFGLNWLQIIDSAVIATLPVLIFMISIGKNLLTTKDGNFLGVTEVIPDKK